VYYHGSGEAAAPGHKTGPPAIGAAAAASARRPSDHRAMQNNIYRINHSNFVSESVKGFARGDEAPPRINAAEAAAQVTRERRTRRRRAPSAVAERSHSSRSDDRLARARAVADRHNETKLCVRCAAVRGALPLLHARARGAARGARRRPVFVASLSRTRATSTATVCSTSSRSSRR
jgi:hypothetical protein